MRARPPSGETREIVWASPSSVHAAEASDTTSIGVAPTATSVCTWPSSGSSNAAESPATPDCSPEPPSTRNAATPAPRSTSAAPAAMAAVRDRRRGRCSDAAGGRSSSNSRRLTRTGFAMPLTRTRPRSSYPRPSTWPAIRTMPSPASTSPARASEQSLAARFRAPPRKPSSACTASPASSPIPTRIGNEGSSRIASAKRCCRAIDARRAWRGESNTQSASSPLSSTVRPPPAPTTSRVSSAKRAVSRAASSSPRSRVNDVYPRMSAIRKARTVAAPATSSNSRR